jgi:hypothetical protein
MNRILLCVGIVPFLVGTARAHDWYDQACCHDKDCRPVKCEDIERITTAHGSGWIWHRDKGGIWFPQDRLKHSLDGNCHACISEATTPPGICLYMPDQI